MFSPDPFKAQEPVFLPAGSSLCVRLKSYAPKPTEHMHSMNHLRDIFDANAIRWRAEKGEIKVTFNVNPHTPAKPGETLTPKFFKATEGEFALNTNMHSVFFTAADNNATLYLEIE